MGRFGTSALGDSNHGEDLPGLVRWSHRYLWGNTSKSVIKLGTVLIGILLSALAIPLEAAQTASIQGTVRDSSGALISGALVTLQSGPDKAETRTDAAGQFPLSLCVRPVWNH